MLQLDLSALERAAKGVQDLDRQMPFMMAEALTKSMYEARDAEYKSMSTVFDRPSRYTLNSIRVEKATRTSLRAELHFKQFGGTPADKYLGPEVRGGPRRKKGFERALERAGVLRASEFVVPSKRMPLDGSGNVRGSDLTKILSAIGAQTDRMQNTTAKSKARKPKRNMGYFVMRGHSKAPDGIYLRMAKWDVPMLLFVRQPVYRKRYPFYEVGHRMIADAMQRQFKAVVGKEIARQARKR